MKYALEAQKWSVRMADKKLENRELEDLLEDFSKDRQKDKYVKVMEMLERAVVLVPSMMPQNISEETEALLKEGKPVQLPKEAKVLPCLLKKESGEQVFPIFTSPAQIPQDKRSPVLLTLPFFSCIAMLMSGAQKLEGMVINPFTHNMVLPWSILEVAEKRRKALQAQTQAQAQGKPVTQTIRVTEKQFQTLVHNQVALKILPKYLYEHQEEGIRKLQDEEGVFLLSLYEGLYPEGHHPQFTQEDFSTLTLNVSEQMQLTRVDLPEEAMKKKGMCYRIYVVWMRDSQTIRYYVLEKTEKGNFIGHVNDKGEHEIIEEAPDNGAEMEAVMELAARE